MKMKIDRRTKLFDRAVKLLNEADAAPTRKALMKKARQSLYDIMAEFRNSEKPAMLQQVKDRITASLSWKCTEFGDWCITINGESDMYFI